MSRLELNQLPPPLERIMKQQLLITIAAVVLVGCGQSQQSAPAPEVKLVETSEPVAEAAKPEPPTVKAPDISIHQAVRNGNIEAVKQHLAAGTDVNAIDENRGITPLVYAAREGHKKIVELLIAKGADVHEKAKDGTTPLLSTKTKEIAELLIAEGANVNAKDMRGMTPLHRATYQGYKEIAELLIAKGADVNAKEKDGYTPLDYAIAGKRSEIIDILRKHGGKFKKELEAAGN